MNKQNLKDSYEDIDADINRTFISKCFTSGNKRQNDLWNLLRAFVNFGGNIGYIQGMNFIAAALLLNVWNVEDAFKLFCHLMIDLKMQELF